MILPKHKLEDIAQICEPETMIYVCTNDVIEGNEVSRAEYIGNEEVKIWGYDQSIDVLMHNFSVSHFVTEQDFIKFMKD